MEKKFLRYTGTKEEFENRYTNNSANSGVAYQCLGDNVTWTLEDGVLTISGNGSTIDLLSEREQPWANIPGKGTRDDQRAAITKVRVEDTVQLGTHMLDYLGDEVETIFSVNVNNGSGSGKYAEGESVTITADEPEAGMLFKEWTGAEGLTFTSGSKTTATATFSMPANAVSLTATYEDAVYTVTLDPGDGYG